MDTERRDNGRFFTSLASIELLTLKQQRALMSSVSGSQAAVYDVGEAIDALANEPEHAALVEKLRALPAGTKLLAFT